MKSKEFDLKDDIFRQCKHLIDEHKLFLIVDLLNDMDHEVKKALMKMIDKWKKQNNFNYE